MAAAAARSKSSGMDPGPDDFDFNNNNADLRDPLGCTPLSQYYENLKFEPPAAMGAPPRMSAREYYARKRHGQVITAAEEGFALDQPSRLIFTCAEQTEMNIRAQTLLLGEIQERHHRVSLGGFGGLTMAEMDKKNDEAIYLLASAAKSGYSYILAEHEVLRHDAQVRIQRNIRAAKELSFEPVHGSHAPLSHRSDVQRAIKTNIRRQFDNWGKYLQEYKKDILNGLINAAYRITGVSPGLNKGLKNLTSRAELALVSHGTFYDDFTHAERMKFWQHRYDRYKHEFFKDFYGFMDLDANFEDPVMGPWMNYIFCVIMDSLWANHIAPERRFQAASLAHPGQLLTRAMFGTRNRTTDDFRRIRASYTGTLPTLDNMRVHRGVLSVEMKPIKLSQHAKNFDYP